MRADFTVTRKWQAIFWRQRLIRLSLVGTEQANGCHYVFTNLHLTSTGLLMEAHYRVDVIQLLCGILEKRGVLRLKWWGWESNPTSAKRLFGFIRP